MRNLFPLTPGKILVMALITGTPSFIFGLLLQANIAGMIAGLGGFALVLLKLWPKLEAALLSYPLWTRSLRFAVMLRVLLSLAGISSFLAMLLLHRSIIEWTVTPDMLGGMGVAMLLSGTTNLDATFPDTLYSGFFATYLATFLQGIVLLVVMLLVMLLTAFLIGLWRKFRLLAA